MTTLVGSGDAIEYATPYHAWRPVFQQLFHLDTVPDTLDTQRMQVLTQL